MTMDEKIRKLSIIKDVTANLDRALTTDSTVKSETFEPSTLTDSPPPPFPMDSPAFFSAKSSSSGDLDNVEACLSRDVKALISKVSSTGKLFDVVHATLQNHASKLKDDADQEQFKSVLNESKALQRRARRLIWDSQKLAVQAAVFVDDFGDIADKVSLLLTQEQTPLAEKLCKIEHYKKWVNERSNDAQRLRDDFDNLKEDISQLSEKQVLAASNKEQVNVLTAEESVSSWVRGERLAQAAAFSSMVFSGPFGWGVLFGGLTMTAVCKDAAQQARRAKIDAETLLREVNRTLTECKDGFLVIADEISDFLNVWQLANTMLIKIAQQLSLTKFDQPELILNRFNKLTEMFRGMRCSLETYGAATFNL